MTPAEFQARCDEMRERLQTLGRIRRKVAKCPACGGEDTIRKGISLKRKQKHFCKPCHAYFIGTTSAVPHARRVIHSHLMCYCCGNVDVIGQGSPNGGRSAYCPRCRKYFTQGGKLDLERYHLLLSDRIAQLKLPPDVALELFQTASVDVLNGVGYCWTVQLNVQAAFTACRGEYGQRGSDDPMYRLQNDNRPRRHKC